MRPCEHGEVFFPSRSRDTGEPAPQPWAAIARFVNAAEAGYFAHELKLLRNVPVTLTAEESFDAVAGFWTTGFVLSVPQSWAEKAALTLQELVRLTEHEEPTPARAFVEAEPERGLEPQSRAFDPFPEDGRFADGNAVHWVPIVLTLAAGSMAIWGVKKFLEPQRPQPAAAPVKAPRDVLWDVMMTPSNRVWVQQDPASGETRELEIDAMGEEAILREDIDGDHVFEQTRRLKRP